MENPSRLEQGVEIGNPPPAPIRVVRLIQIFSILTAPLIIFTIFTIMSVDKVNNLEKAAQTSSLDSIPQSPELTQESFNPDSKPKFTGGYAQPILKKSLKSVGSAQIDPDSSLEENMQVEVVLLQITLPEFSSSESEESEEYGGDKAQISRNEGEIPMNIGKLMDELISDHDSSEVIPPSNSEGVVENKDFEGLGDVENPAVKFNLRKRIEKYLAKKNLGGSKKAPKCIRNEILRRAKIDEAQLKDFIRKKLLCKSKLRRSVPVQ